MICSKCNSEIPNGAKFCTVCGTPTAAAEPEKSFCAKCGTELAAGAKFCTVCGTPTAANPAPVAAAQAVVNDAASAVSLNKEPNADDLVAAMNTAAPAAAAPVPTPAPSAAVPTPVPTPAPAQAPAASVMPQPGYNSGFAPTGAPGAPEMPGFAPTGGQMPAAGDAAGLNGAAVAAVVPEKVKKSPVGKILLIVGIVIVAIAGAAAAWFFSNKASFLSTFMGKPKYAAMVEKETLKKVTKDLNTESLSNSIKTLTSTVGPMLNSRMNPLTTLGGYGAGSNIYLSDKTAAGAGYADMAEYADMMVNPYSSNPFDGMDIRGMISSYHEFMQSTYGADAITGNISVKVEDLGGLGNSDDVLEILNGMNITYDYAATDSAFGTLIGAEFGNGSRFDIKYVVEEDGSIYIAFPFASKTGFKYKTTPTGGSSAIQGTEGLDLAPEEIDRLLNEVIDIYLAHVKKASVEMNGGSLYVAGKEISGKLIVADINGANLENLVKEIFEHIANDAYFCKQIVEYINNFDPSFTEADFKNGVTDMVRDISGITENDKLVIKTIVDNGGKTLAKSFGFVKSGNTNMEIAFADNDSMTVFEVLIEGDSLMKFENEKTDDKNGKITIKVSDMDANDPSAISIIVDYKGVEEVEFGKSKVDVGTYTISMNVPRDIDSFDDEEIDMINGSSFTVGSTVSGNTINYNIGATLSGNVKFDLNMDLTISDDTSVINPPSDVIDITNIASGGEPDKATTEKLEGFLADLTKAVEGSGLEEIFGDLFGGGSMSGPQPGPNDPVIGTRPNSALEDAFNDLMDEVWDSYYEVESWIEAYEVYEGDSYEAAKKYENDLGDLWDKLYDVLYSGNNNDLSQKQLEEYTKAYNEIYKNAESILKGLWKDSTIPNAPSPTLPFDPYSGNIDPTPSGGVYGPDGNLITTPAFAPDER